MRGNKVEEGSMNLKEYFDSIDLAVIHEFVSIRRQEDLHLDFKQAPNGMDSDTRKNFAKALSGFANSDGGIIVWGVSARKVDDIDAADSPIPVQQLSQFVSALNSFTGQYVSPLVDGVEHRAIDEPSMPNSGYVVTLVPTSDLGPHMAKGGEDRYYKRSGDSFRRMEHYEVADLFGRRPHAHLDLCWSASYHDRRVNIEVGMANSGRGLARFPYIELEVNQPYEIHPISGGDNRTFNGLSIIKVPRVGSRHLGFGASGGAVVYPGGLLLVAEIVTKIPEGKPTDIPRMLLSYSMSCEGCLIKPGTIELLHDDIIAKKKSTNWNGQ